MKKILFALWLLMGVGIVLPARSAGDDGRTYYVYGQVFNPVTRERLKDVFAELLTVDSVVVDTMRTDEGSSFNNKRGPWHFNLVKYGERPYIVRLSKEGYRPTYVNIPAPKLEKMKPDDWVMEDMSPAFMRRAPRDYQLGEASVTATRVVFCQRGDTLVYNADALALPEGSTLDALIRQLPGVELKEGGQIYVNGRYVEQLLLGGKDFFDSDRQLILDNLPSFMVKNVEVYEKDTELNKFIGRSVDEKKLVMDVKLKKQYHIGTVANVEAGGGTEGRYMGRLFAMRFTPRSRLTLVGNVNNLNDNRKPGQNTTWTPDVMPTGTFVTKMGGVDYNFEDELTGWKVSTEFQGRHTTSNNYSEQSSEQFFEGGNTFGRSFSRNHSGRTQLSLHNNFSYTGKKIRTWGNLWGSLSRNRNRGTSASGTFSENPEDYIDGHVLDSLQGPASGDLLRRLALNRTLQASRGSSDNAAGGVFLQTAFKMFGISAAFNYNVSDDERFRHYQLDYPASGQASDFQNRYTHRLPDYSLGYNVNASYMFFLGKGFLIIPSYSLNGRYGRQSNALHRLERLDGWGEGTDHALGMLPSETEWVREQTLDDKLSYVTRLEPINHEAKLHFQYEHSDERRNKWRVEMDWPLNVNIQRVYHKRDTYEDYNRVRDIYVNPSFRVERRWHSYQRMWELKYNVRTQVPDFLGQLLDLPYDDDPLNVTTGNPDLRPSVKHEWSFTIQLNDSERQRTFGAWTTFYITANAIARGFVYNHATGVRSYRPENVNGNSLWQTSVNYSQPIDRKKRLTLSSYTFFQLQHGVDLITVTDGADATDVIARPSRSTVNTTWTTETLNLTYRKGFFSVGANGFAGYNHSRSHREGFVSQHVWQYNYGLTGQVELPGKVQVSTDLKMYGHRGFSDPAANTDDLVWNVRLSRHFAKANLTVMLDGFDLLHQLSNRTFFMNSQGRFETYNNALPAYFMGHIIFRLNKQPKQ